MDYNGLILFILFVLVILVSIIFIAMYINHFIVGAITFGVLLLILFAIMIICNS